MTAAARMRTPELLDRLRRHYIKPGDLPGGVFLPEVTHGTAGGRRADALYIGFVRSRGLHLLGHELKVSRSDWLHELDQIHKADVWASQCHAFYVVAPDTTIVHPDEVPTGWGLLVVDPRTKTRLQRVVTPIIDNTVQPDWTTVHSILKRIDTLHHKTIQDTRTKALADVDAELADLRGRASMLTLATPDAHLARAERAEALVTDLGRILGVDVTAGGWASTGTMTLDDLRGAFAEFLRARRDSQAALTNRASALGNARNQLEAALAAVGAAERALLLTGNPPQRTR